MNFKKIPFFMMIIVSMFSSCTPKVVTDIIKTYPPTNPNKVAIYETYDSVQTAAEQLGTLKVIDSGFTTDCGLNRMLKIAREETAKVGGNALKLTDHRFPDLFGSSCHRLYGVILNIADTLAVDRQIGIDIHENGYFYRQMPTQDAINKQREMPNDLFRVSYGPSWLVSKYYAPKRVYNSKAGWEGSFSYEHVWKKGYGFGIDMSLFRTVFDGEDLYTNAKYDLMLFYLGPSFVINAKITKKWQYNTAIGLGYASYNENGDYTEGGVGVMLRAGIDYCFSKHFGVGVDMNLQTAVFKRPDNVDKYMEPNERYGFERLNILAGLRYFF
jgi:hypothetical protein